MKTSFLIIIILNYTFFIHCIECKNVTEDFSDKLCTLRAKRHKRSYTRWRSDQGSTPFIVQVPDDEVTIKKPKSIIGVNIMPLKKNGEEKIIVGVPIISKPTTELNAFNDYTRFVPLSGVPDEDSEELKRILLEKIDQIRPKGKSKTLNSERRARPSVPPKVLTRTSIIARQFAPALHSPSFTKLMIPTPTRTIETTKYPTRQVITYSPHATRSTTEEGDCDDDPITRTNSGLRRTTAIHPKPSRIEGTEFQSNILEENDERDLSYDSWFHNEDQDDFDSNEKLWNSKENQYNIIENDWEILNKTKSSRKHLSGIKNTKSSVNKKLNESQAVCSMIKLRSAQFNSAWTLPEIMSQLKKWAEDSPVAKWVDITNGNMTTMDNSIYMMIVDDPSRGQIVSAKQTVLIVAGIQGRDHHAVTAAMYVLHQLIEKTEAHTDLLTKYRFWIVPVLNPDGYDYSITFPKNREWSKNLRQSWDECKGQKFCANCNQFGLRCTVQRCVGVHLDRNFEYQWISSEDFHTENPCDDLYAGPRQLSESETISLTKYLEAEKSKPFTFIAFKEGDILGVMYPHSHTKKRRPRDNEYRLRASRAASTAYTINGRLYVSGQTSEHLPLYAGGIEDWMESHLGVDNSYVIIMHRPSDITKLSTERLSFEAFAAMDTLLLESMNTPAPSLSPFHRRSGNAQLIATPCLVVIALVCSRVYNP